MDVEAFLLCDAATEQQGKLNVLGAFDSIFAKKVPTVHPACAIAARLRFSKVEQGEHAVKISVIDEDGKEVVPKLEGKVSVRVGPASPAGGDEANSAVINLILNFQRLKLPEYGEYRVDLAVDGEQKASLPLFVRSA
jgi:hypothetical protein